MPRPKGAKNKKTLMHANNNVDAIEKVDNNKKGASLEKIMKPTNRAIIFNFGYFVP